MLSKAHIKAVMQGLFVTFLWPTSWALIKYGLQAGLPAKIRWFMIFPILCAAL